MIARRHVIAGLAFAAVAVLAFAIGQGRSGAESMAASTTAAPASPDLPRDLSISATELRNMNLRIATAQLQPVVRTAQVNGTLTFTKMHMAQVNALARGRIESIEVRPGQDVKAGQTLAVVDYFNLGEVRGRIVSARSALLEAKAEDAAAQAAFKRAMAQVQMGALATSELERRRADAARTAAMVQTREAELQYQLEMEARLAPAAVPESPHVGEAFADSRLQRARGVIVAPLDGDVDTVNVSPGEIVNETTAVFSIANISTITLIANVPERILPTLRLSDTVTLHVDTFPGRQFSGRIVRIADEVDPRTGTAMVTCMVPNDDGALRVGMFATVNIASPQNRQGVLVPDAALQDIDGKTAVFVPTGHDHFTWRVVQTGIDSNGYTEVTQGLEASTPVVADGSFWLKAALLRATIPDE